MAYKNKIKRTPITRYLHECEHVGLMLITGIMMQHKVLYLRWEVGSKGILVIPIYWGRGTCICLLSSFLCLGLGR